MKKDLIITLILFFTLIMIEALWVHAKHPEFAWQHIKGFYALLGLVGSIGLMFFAKSVGKFFLFRKEGYYKES